MKTPTKSKDPVQQNSITFTQKMKQYFFSTFLYSNLESGFNISLCKKIYHNAALWHCCFLEESLTEQKLKNNVKKLFVITGGGRKTSQRADSFPMCKT